MRTRRSVGQLAEWVIFTWGMGMIGIVLVKREREGGGGGTGREGGREGEKRERD